MKKRIFSALLAIIMVLSTTAFAANVVAFDLPVGDEHMPADLVMGGNSAEIAENSSGYYYTWTAEQNGTLTLKIVSPDDWTYVVNNLTTSYYGDTQWSDSDPVVNPYIIEVQEGDELQIIVNTYDPTDIFNTPAETFIFEASFTADEITDDSDDTDELTQNEYGYYELGSVSDFEAFAAYINNGDCDLNAVMTADIDISSTMTMIGNYSDYPYSGIFDGANHTLTIDYNSCGEYAAPFRFVDGATIENLTVKGEIYTGSKFAAGLIGESRGFTVINNCISDIVIDSALYGDGTHGGLVGVNREELYMTNCAFVGKMIGYDTDSNGGLVGWTDNNVSMTNCYVSASFETSSYNSNTFVRNDSPNITLTNCYYVNSYGGTRGATHISEDAVGSGELVYKLNSGADGAFKQTIGEDEYPNFTGDTVYYNAGDNTYTNTVPQSYTITIDENTQHGTISAPEQAHENSIVTVTVNADLGYRLDTLVVMNGDVPVETNGNTFVMPSGDVTVTATFKVRTYVIIGENENTSTNESMPFHCNYYYSICQYVVPAERLEDISGKVITDISYFYEAVGNFVLDQHVTVYVQEGESFGNTSSYRSIDNATKIYDGTVDLAEETLNIEELKLTLNTPFGYSGGDLLFTVFKQADDCYGAIDFLNIPSETLSLSSYSDYNDFVNDGLEDAYVSTANVIPKMKFDFVSADTYNITVADDIENGTVTSNCNFGFAGAKVILTLTPDEGYTVDTVTYNDGTDHVITPVNGVYSFTMPTSDVTISATFRALASYSITVDDSISFGTVEAPASAYEENTVTLTITPDDGYVLESLTVMQGETAIDVSETYTFVMPSGDVTISAIFNYPDIWVGGTRINPYNTSDVFGDGKVSYDIKTHTLTLNNYTYTGSGNEFEYFYNNTHAVIYSQEPLNIVLVGENVLTHEINDCRVSMVVWSAEDISFSGDGSLVVTACDADVYSRGIYSQQGDITINSGTITATTGNSPHSCGIETNSDIYFNGGIVTAYGSFVATKGACVLNDVELIEPADGHYDQAYVYDENGNLSHHAKIGPAERYTISATDDGNGTVTPNLAEAIAGRTIRLDIQADEGYGVDTLTVLQGEIPVEVSKDYTFKMPEGNVTISATFRILNSYTITVDENIENGTVTAPEEALERSTVTLTVTPEDGYSLNEITVMQGEIPVEVSKDCTFVMPEGDVTVSAVFKKLTHFIVGEDANLTSDAVPFNTYYKHSVSQYVIPADMLTEANNGIINNITYYYTPDSSSASYPITLKVYLQEIAESFPKDNHFTSLEGVQKVYEGTLNLSTDREKVHELPLNFDVGYVYTGGNILVTVIKSADNYFPSLNIPSISGYSRTYETDHPEFDPEKITTYSPTLEGRVPKCKISFLPATSYDITIDDSIENGTVTASADSIFAGRSVTLTVTPDEGYILDTLTVMQDDTPVEVSEDYTFVMPEGNVTISASFRALQSYTITIDENIENGIVISPESAFERSTVTLTIDPGANCVLETLTVMCGDVPVEVSENYTFVMPEGNVTISATFKELTDLIIGEDATNTNGYVPFRTFYNNAVSQYVIPSGMLKLIKGKIITDLTYYYTPQSDSKIDVTLSVYLNNIDSEDFTAGSFIPLTAAQKAYEGTLSDLSTDSENVHEMILDLDYPHYYNGGDLLVTIFKTADEYVTDLKFQCIEGAASYVFSDYDTYSPESLAAVSAKSSEFIPKTKLGFSESEIYNIEVADGIENGTVTTSVDATIENNVVLVTATSDEGYTIDTVTYNDGEEDHVITPVNGVYSFIMPACDVTVSATFKELMKYTITVDENIKYGTIQVAESAYEQWTVPIQFTPDDGCVLTSLSVMQGENAIEVSENYTFEMPSSDVTISATFAYPLQVGGIAVTPDNASDILGDGSAVYSVSENKLALNNYSYNGKAFKVYGDYGYNAAIAYSGTQPFTLVLSGDNTITVTDDENETIYGIFTSTNITINGTGTLNVEVSGENASYVGAIRSLRKANISNVTLNVSAGDASTTSYGIHCGSDIDILDANVKASGGYAVDSTGLVSMDGKIKITDSPVIAESSDEAHQHWAIYANEGIELNGVHIVTPAGAFINDSTIIYSGSVIAPVVSIAVDEIFTLAGDLDVFVNEWDPGYSANDLVWNGQTLKYEKTYENVPAGNYLFKITKDHKWPGYGTKTNGECVQNGVALELAYNSDNISLNLPAGAKTLIFALDPENLTITVSWYDSVIVGVDENGEPTHYMQAIPFYNFYLHSIAQHIIPAEMIDTEHGVIDALTWYYYQSSQVLNRNLKIYLTEIDGDSITNFVPIDESALVFDGNVTLEEVSENYEDAKGLYVKLDRSYEYTGKNLLVTVISAATDDSYTAVYFLGTQNNFSSENASAPFKYDDFAGFDLNTLKDSIPIDSSPFVPMTKIDFKEDTAPKITFEGAQIRTSGEQGLRFVFSMDKEYYDTLNHPTSYAQTGEGFGSVVLPKDLIDTSLTKESAQAAIVPAVVLFDTSDTTVKYTVCLTGITDYEREYSAIPYVTDSAGNTTYGELADGISVYEIAELCYADENTSETVKEYLLTNILNTVNPEKYPIAE